MYNAGDRKDIRRAEKAAKLAENLRIDFIRRAMTSADGRAWFHDLLAGCHLFSDPFSGDALIEAYSKGERNVGLRIFSDLLAQCPDQYIAMMREANERDYVRNTATERTGVESAGWNDFESDDDDGA